MKIGLNIPATLTSPDQLEEWVRRVDAGPFSTLSVLDRVVYSNLEPLVNLAAAAALTTCVRLMTEVLISLIRSTTILAKESATLDLLSRGRLILGIGLGAGKMIIWRQVCRMNIAGDGWTSNWSS